MDCFALAFIVQQPGGLSLKQTAASPVTNSVRVPVPRQNHRREASGKIIRSILLNKNSRQSPSVLHSETKIQTSNQVDKRPPRPSNVQLFLRDASGASEEVANDLHGFCTEKQEKCTRNKDRPDRGVWTPLYRSDGSHASDKSLSSSTLHHTHSLLDPAEGNGDTKNDILSARSGESKNIGSERICHSAVDNGTYKHVGCRGPQHNLKYTDGSSIVREGKPLKRGGSSSYSSHEKQVWVQKSSSGS